MNDVTRGISHPVLWLSGLLILAGAVSCAPGPDDGIEGEARALNAGLRVSGLPAGLVCALSYQFNSSVAEDNACSGVRTVSGQAATGFTFRSVGDRGLNAGRGFIEQVARGSGSATPGNSDRLTLLRGTACGCKEQCNNSGELCMGWDPSVSCPPGWSQRSGADANGFTCRYYWCEYDDPNQVCCDGSTCDPACAAAMPSGTACGVNDLRVDNEWCGMSWGSCPAGFHPTKGRYDSGRMSGDGLAWCTKN
jgi:hypothetical protein